MTKLRRIVRRYWAIINQPSAHFSLGFLVVGSFIAGIVFWGGFNTAMEITNTEAFCTGCHEMNENPVCGAAANDSLHQPQRCPCDMPGLSRAAQLDAQNRTQDAGVKGSLGKDFRHDQYAGKVSRHAARLAQHEGARMKANDSLECRNCHAYLYMDFTRQSPRAAFVTRAT